MTEGRPATGARLDARMMYTLVCLMLAYVLSFVDRTILSLMLDPIRKEFGLSDTEVSLLAGIAFALFYAILGLPMGRIADTSHRRRLIVVGMIAWSIATAMCGTARSFVTLFLARMGVGVGEATLTPASYSLIGDLVPRERLGTAMSIYAIGATLGSGLAMVLGGALVQWAMAQPPIDVPLLGELSGWRLVFVLAGTPGVFLAALIAFTVPEPPRRTPAAKDQASFGPLWAHIREHLFAFIAVILGFSLVAVTIYTFIVWAPAYLSRVHQMKPVEIGFAIGTILGIGGSLGSIVGGYISDILARRGRLEAPVFVIMLTQVIHIPFLVAGFLAPSAGMAIALLATGMFILSAFGGLQHSTLQAMTPGRLRGQMAAIYGMATSLIGFGLGPVLAGLLTDLSFGPEGIGRALALMSPIVAVASAALLWSALKAVRRTMETIAATEASR